jgi:hypothetical protein
MVESKAKQHQQSPPTQRQLQGILNRRFAAWGSGRTKTLSHAGPMT